MSRYLSSGSQEAPEGEMEAALPLVTKDSVEYSSGIIHIQDVSRDSSTESLLSYSSGQEDQGWLEELGEEAGLEMATL